MILSTLALAAPQYAQIAGLIGLGLPVVIAFIQRETWPSAYRAVATVVACAIAAAIIVVIKTDFTAKTWTTAFLADWITALVAYEHFWKPVGVPAAIHAATRRR